MHFGTYNNKPYTYVKACFYGGKIIAGKNAINFIEKDAGDYVYYGPNANGEYLTVEAPSGSNTSKLLGNVVSTSGRIMEYKLNGGVYKLTERADTGYTVPADNTSAFVLFNADTKAYIGGYSTLNEAITGANSKGSSNNYYIRMTTASGNSNGKATLGSLLATTVTVDLGGGTLNLSSTLFDLYVGANSNTLTPDMRTIFTFKNGTVKRSAGTLLVVNYDAKISHDAKTVFNFDGITFVSTASGWAFFNTWENGFATAPAGVKYVTELTFNDCVFDMAASAQASRYLAIGSFTFSPSLNAGLGDTGVRM